MYSRNHDPLGFISSDRTQSTLSNLPVPVGMFMNMAHVPPRFYNQQQQALQGSLLIFVFLFCIKNINFIDQFVNSLQLYFFQYISSIECWFNKSNSSSEWVISKKKGRTPYTTSI